MEHFPRETVFTIVLDVAYPRLTLNHRLTLSLRNLPERGGELLGLSPLPPVSCKELRENKGWGTGLWQGEKRVL